MPEILRMPQMGMTMKEGTITKWYKKVGDRVKKGEFLFQVLTDKANMDVESPVEGVLFVTLVNEGEEAKIGDPIAIIRLDDDTEVDIEQVMKNIGHESAKISEDKQIEKQSIDFEKRKSDVEKYIPATPLAKKIAKESNVNLTPEMVNEFGFISSKNIPIKKAPIVVNSYMTAMMKRMEESNKIPQFTLYYDIVADGLLEAKKNLESKGYNIGITPILIKLIAEKISEYKIFSYAFKDGNLVQNPVGNIGIAVETDEGLVVPVVKSVNEKKIGELLKEYRSLISKARDKKLSIEDMEGGTVTVSNLGNYDIDHFRALVVPGQSAIFAVSTIKNRVVVENKGIFIRQVFNISISCDHRFIDGATAAKLMLDIKKIIENGLLEEVEKWE
ncbi:MAG: dihydrolipoamide acetyltransferase family protein [Nitrososphaeria archaeon]